MMLASTNQTSLHATEISRSVGSFSDNSYQALLAFKLGCLAKFKSSTASHKTVFTPTVFTFKLNEQLNR
eukprot:1157254-Pelagomonas_calceolata.AAC.4